MIVLGCAAPIACVFMGKKTGNWKVYGSAAIVCAVIGAMCLRVVFYLAGAPCSASIKEAEWVTLLRR